jgi:hypothetical protein
MYSLVMLACTIASWSYFSIFFQGKRKLGIVFVFAHALGFFAHYWFLFFVAAEGLVLLVKRRPLKRFVILSAISFAPFGVLWLPRLPSQLAASRAGLEWLARPGLSSLVSVVASFCGWGLIGLGFIACWRLAKHKGSSSIREWARDNCTQVSALLLLFSIAIPFSVSQFKPMFHPRYTVIGLQFFALPIGQLLTRLLSRRQAETRVDIATSYGSSIGSELSRELIDASAPHPPETRSHHVAQIPRR